MSGSGGSHFLIDWRSIGKPERLIKSSNTCSSLAAFFSSSLIAENFCRCLPADDSVYFTVGALRASVDQSRLGPPKSASEGAERDRIWPATVPTRDGTVLQVTAKRLIVQMNADAGRAGRRQTYPLRGKSIYVSPGDTFKAQTTILAGVPPELADLSAYLRRRYTPLDDLHADTAIDRYAAVKALRFRDDPRDRVIPALEDLVHRETEERVALEAAGSAAALGSEFGQEQITRFVWDNDDRPELRMEACSFSLNSVTAPTLPENSST